MKILVDKMPKKAEDCPWAYSNDRRDWSCGWCLRNSKTCTVVKGGECPYFTTISQQTNLDCIIDAFNAVPEVYPITTQEAREIIIRNPNRKECK